MPRYRIHFDDPELTERSFAHVEAENAENAVAILKNIRIGETRNAVAERIE